MSHRGVVRTLARAQHEKPFARSGDPVATALLDAAEHETGDVREPLPAFPPMRISVTGAGVARTVSYDPNTGREARIAVTPRQPGTLRIITSGQYYDSGSTTVQVGT